jgi:uroporphyrinogen-III decarboxylase
MEELTYKQSVLAAVKGAQLNRIPFGARIDFWYNYHKNNDSLPERYKNWSMPEINRDLGAGTLFRLNHAWRAEYHGLEARTYQSPPHIVSEFETPYGRLRSKTLLDEQGGHITGYITEHLFKSTDDYPALVYLIEHERMVPDMTEHNRLVKLAGDDATIAVGNATGPMQIIMKEIMGYETFFYELHDNSKSVERLHDALKEQWNQKLKILAESDVEFPVLCGNWSGEIHTPIFQRYFLPWLQEASDYLHRHGKIAMLHVDGELRGLLPYLAETGADVLDCWSPWPMTSLTTAELRKAVGDRMTIWGGVASQLFESTYSDAQFDEYVRNLIKEMAPGYRFVMGMGENVSPLGKIERVRRVADLIDEAGPLPIHTSNE